MRGTRNGDDVIQGALTVTRRKELIRRRGKRLEVRGIRHIPIKQRHDDGDDAIRRTDHDMACAGSLRGCMTS